MYWRRKKINRPKFRKSDERFLSKCLKVIAVSTAIFTAAQYFSFLITQVEQTVLIEWYYKVVGFECGAMMLKRIVEIVVARIKKKENIDVDESSTDEQGGYYDE